MHETVVDAGAILAELASAPMAPKRRRRRKVDETQMSFDFDAADDSDIVDDEASEAAEVLGPKKGDEVKIPGPCRSEIPTSKEDEAKRLRMRQSITPRRRRGSVRPNLPAPVLTCTSPSGPSHGYQSERRSGARGPP